MVLIGEGACADAALESIRIATGTAVILCTEKQWRESGRPATGKGYRSLHFDPGTVPECRQLLASLGKRTPRPMAFLAGGVPKTTSFCAALDSSNALARGASPAAYERRSIEAACARQGLILGSLHGAEVPLGHLAPSSVSADAQAEELIERHRAELLATLKALRRDGGRPEIRDDGTRAARSSIVFHRIPGTVSAIVARWRDHDDKDPNIGMFDTAFVDHSLIDSFIRKGVRRIVLEKNVIIIDPAKVFDLCATTKTELQLCDADLVD